MTGGLPPADSTDLIYRLGMALAIGLLVGTERHWRERDDPPGRRTAGIRTFGLSGLLGGLAAALGGPARDGAVTWPGAAIIGAVFVGFSAALLLFHGREAVANRTYSVTTLVAGQATFLLGAMAILGNPAVVAAAAVAMTAVLAAREGLHDFVSRLTWPELRSALLLLSMTLAVLPLVPDRDIAALAGLNLAHIWKLTVILASVSYAGYIAVRLLGPSAGLLASGAVTGLVSSTAATIANARLVRAGGAAVPTLTAATLVAGAVSLVRTAVFAWGVAPAVGLKLMPALILAAVVHAAAGAALAWRHGAHGTLPAAQLPSNPFEFRAVLQIALVLGLVELLATLAARGQGSSGVFAVAALSGLTDVDAVTLSMGSLVPEPLTETVAALAIIIAVAANTVAKAAYGIALGSLAYGLGYGAIAVGSLAVAAVVQYGAVSAGWLDP